MCIFIVIWESFARLFDHHGQQPGKQKKTSKATAPVDPIHVGENNVQVEHNFRVNQIVTTPSVAQTPVLPPSRILRNNNQ